MKFFFKIVILFLIIFSWRIPYVYNTVFASMILVTAYYIISKKRIPFTYFFQRYVAVILICSVILAFIIFAFTVFHHTNVIAGVQKRVWVMLQMICAVIYALPIFIEGEESNPFDEMCVIICYVFAVQGLIHLTAYLYEPLGDFLFDMKPEGIKEKVLDPRFNVDRFRLYCLSGIVFVELVAAYGVAFILFFRLQLQGGHPYFNGWKQYVVLFFLIMGTSLAGRTGFVGLGLGLLLWFLFSYNRIFVFLNKNIVSITVISILLLFSFNFLLSSQQRTMFNSELFPYSFEWFYNYRDYGTFSVVSLEATEQQHYFYLRDETLLKGHGEAFEYISNSIYPPTDAGYMNILIFGGIPFLICLIIYQSLYFLRPISIARKTNTYYNRIDAACFIILFIYIFILNYKTSALGTLHTVETLYIAAGSTYIIRSYSNI